MYKTFFSLSKTPFSKEFKTNEAFVSQGFKELSARFEYLKKTRGIGLLTGQPGAGKTFSLRCFAESLNTSLFKVIYFPLASLSVMDFYKGLAMALGEDPRFRKVDLFMQIQKTILNFYKERKITPVIILDELHLALDAFLADISLLFNFNMDSENPFILVLSGLTHLQNKLTLNQHRPLAQRLMFKFNTDGLSSSETTDYISYHMKIAGANYEIFAPQAIQAIHSYSHGLPRVINQVATNCLLCAFQEKKQEIDSDIVRIATDDMKF